MIEQDFIAPVVNLSGSSSITVAQGSIYTDLGADWIDTIDGTGHTLVGTY